MIPFTWFCTGSFYFHLHRDIIMFYGFLVIKNEGYNEVKEKMKLKKEISSGKHRAWKRIIMMKEWRWSRRTSRLVFWSVWWMDEFLDVARGMMMMVDGYSWCGDVLFHFKGFCFHRNHKHIQYMYMDNIWTYT